MVYQLFYLKQAISELTHKQLDSKLRIDHLNGHNYVNNLKIPITFPIYLKNFIQTMNTIKHVDYVFIGTISKNRDWIQKYKTSNSIIRDSNYGRNNTTKYDVDRIYYETMCKSRFALTPTGVCNWSYRFFEAIMCMCIPVLENNSKDIHMKDYFCLFDDEHHVYDEQKALQNYITFINSRHFLHNIKELKHLF
jgi:hypothetical protein